MKNVKAHVLRKGVPIVSKEQNTFTIYKDGRYQLEVNILNPDYNPARDAFRQEDRMQDWELQRILIDEKSITGFDGTGKVIMSHSNEGNPYFSRLVTKIMTDDYFAKHVNIGNALFRVSSGAENFLDPKLRDFFLDKDTKFEEYEGFLMVRQNAGKTKRLWGDVLSGGNPVARVAPIAPRDYDLMDPNSSFSPEETKQQIQEDVDFELNQRNVDQVEIITAIDLADSTITAEAYHYGEEQIIHASTLEDAQNGIHSLETIYTEDFEFDNYTKTELINIESIEFSDVQIVNTLQ